MQIVDEYVEGATLPDLEIWWRQAGPVPNLLDFSTGWTFSATCQLLTSRTALWTKTVGFVGAAGSGTKDDGTPNLRIGWAAGDLGSLAEGDYRVDIVATRTSDAKPRKKQIRLRIGQKND